MADFQFHADFNTITPRLEAAVGRVILEWAVIDDCITQLCHTFWCEAHPNDAVPRPFDKRSKAAKSFAKIMYLDRLKEPDEWVTFAWYIQRLRNLNDKRDDIAHGHPGRITVAGKSFDGLMIPRPWRKTRFEKQSLSDIEQLGEDLRRIRAETLEVSYAFYQAHAASSPNKQAWQDQNGWKQVTKENRSPKLPRWNVPPPTFQP